MRNMNDLNFYQTNISFVFWFLYKAKQSVNPTVCPNMFIEIHQNYPKKFS